MSEKMSEYEFQSYTLNIGSTLESKQAVLNFVQCHGGYTVTLMDTLAEVLVSPKTIQYLEKEQPKWFNGVH